MKLLSIINASRHKILLRMRNTCYPNSVYEYILWTVEEIYVDQAEEGQIKTCKMEQALAVYAAAGHVDRVQNYPPTKRIPCH
jgi:hypothetical protein